MAKNAGLPWDCIFSAELFHHYKPDPETYLGAAATARCRPAETMMVAAHEDDLVAARQAGLRTAFVRRPREFGHRDARCRRNPSTSSRTTSSTWPSSWTVVEIASHRSWAASVELRALRRL